MDSMKFRRKLLARAIVNPKLSEREWGELVDNDILMEIHEKVNEALAETITDKDDFQWILWFNQRITNLTTWWGIMFTLKKNPITN